jgi:hypothetical protein
LAAVTPDNIGTLGNGTISASFYDLVYNFERTQLIIAGGQGTAAGTRFGQLAFWNPTTNTFGSYGFVGTGTGFVGVGNVPTGAQIQSILPWSYGTYYLGGHMHRINGALIGSRWNLFQWDGAGVPTAVAPVSATGTGFVLNLTSLGLGSQPGYITSLNRFDQNRILATSTGNTLRGFGTGINTALYDVRGTWGTIPGLSTTEVLSESEDSIKTDDQRVFIGLSNSVIGSVMVQVSGLTASNVGTINLSRALKLEKDPDTLLWVSIGEPTIINNVTPVAGLTRTNGFDYIPADFIFEENSFIDAMYTSTSGTLYAGPVTAASPSYLGTAAALGTIQNDGMSNVYPTLRIRNPSSGTAVIRQWANMTTKEYAWFALNMFPGETVELTTGPGRVAFQSTYRGDILSTIVAGSKLASWHLQPGANIISFLADTDAVVADMYWTPRHHSADGTGIV